MSKELHNSDTPRVMAAHKLAEGHGQLFEYVTIQNLACDLERENARLREALKVISEWNSFPETGQKWRDGTPLSYAAAYGSNGERDYMRNVAQKALTPSEFGG